MILILVVSSAGTGLFGEEGKLIANLIN